MDQLCAEVSVYPLKNSNGSSIIEGSIDSLKQYGLDYSVGSISTHLHGSEAEVWQGLKEMFHSAKNQGEVSMVVTITNSADK